MGKADFGNGASPGKIFIGGLAKDTTSEQFVKYFGKYGEITDSVIMKDRETGRPRGFGFITYADPSVVDTVIAEVHIINDKQVEIKRTIPKGSAESKNFKTKKIFVGGIPTSVSEDEFKSFFSKYGNVVEREIIRDHVTKRSRGFGFIVFESDQAVDTILADGNLIDMDGTQVEIKKAEPKKPSNPGPAPAFSSDSRKHAYDEGFNGYDAPYSNVRSGGFGPAPYRSYGTAGYGPGPGPGPYRSFGAGGFGPAPYRSFGSRYGDYGGYGGGGASEFGGGYGDFPAGGDYGSKFGDYSGYSGGGAGRYGSYGSGGYGGGGLGAYGQGSGYDGYSGAGSGAGYEAGPGGSHGEPEGPYGGRTGYGGGGRGRYHPYAR